MRCLVPQSQASIYPCLGKQLEHFPGRGGEKGEEQEGKQGKSEQAFSKSNL